jgi:cell wall-associated NlpC family hydrolase
VNYSKLLLKCAATQSTQNTTLLMNLYGGKNNMKHRLFSIMDQSKKRSGKLLLALFLGIVSTTAIVATSNHTDAFASINSKIVTADSAVIPSVEGTTAANIIENATATLSSKDSDLTARKTTQNDSKVTASIDVSDAELLRETVVTYAKQSEDALYIWGGNDLSTGVDCSGFIQAIYKKIGYDLPRYSNAQLRACEVVSNDNLLPGDLIFYANSDDVVNHVGIYLGDDKISHASNARDGVKVSDINYRTMYCAGRIITD